MNDQSNAPHRSGSVKDMNRFNKPYIGSRPMSTAEYREWCTQEVERKREAYRTLFAASEAERNS